MRVFISLLIIAFSACSHSRTPEEVTIVSADTTLEFKATSFQLHQDYIGRRANQPCAPVTADIKGMPCTDEASVDSVSK